MYAFVHIFACVLPKYIPLQERYMVSMVYYTDEITGVLHDQFQGSGKPLLFLLHGLNTDSNNYAKPAEFEVLTSYIFLSHHK